MVFHQHLQKKGSNILSTLSLSHLSLAREPLQFFVLPSKNYLIYKHLFILIRSNISFGMFSILIIFTITFLVSSLFKYSLITWCFLYGFHNDWSSLFVICFRGRCFMLIKLIKLKCLSLFSVANDISIHSISGWKTSWLKHLLSR